MGDHGVEEESRSCRNGLCLVSRQEVSLPAVGCVDLSRRLRHTLIQDPHLPRICCCVDRRTQRGHRICPPPSNQAPTPRADHSRAHLCAQSFEQALLRGVRCDRERICISLAEIYHEVLDRV